MADVKASGDSIYTQLNQGLKITNVLKRNIPIASKYRKMQADGEKRPTLELESRKWKVEYQVGKNDVVINNEEMHNVAYVYKCLESTIKIQGKINTVTVDTCEKLQMDIDDVVASLELINCDRMTVQLSGKVPTIALDKCTGCQIYLNNHTLDVEVITSNSSEINILVPNETGDFDEYPVPEMFKSTVVPGKGLDTTCVKK